MEVDVAVFCGLIALSVPIDDQIEKWPDRGSTLSDCSFFLYNLPLFPVLEVGSCPGTSSTATAMLCIILMVGPEGPVKGILSNVP